MDVVLVAPRYAPSTGGVEAHVEALAGALSASAASVTVLTQSHRRFARCDGDVEVYGFRQAFPTDAYPVSPGLLRWLRRAAADVDIIHAHSYHGAPALAAAVAARGAFVFTPHYHGDGHTPLARLAHRGYRHLGTRIFDRADRVVCVSDAEADLVAAHHPRVASRIDVVPNGVDVGAITSAVPFASSRPVVLTLGRLLSYKRVDAVVRAVARAGAEAELVVVGDGPARPQVEGLARELQVSARFTGRVATADVHRWLRTAAVVVSASAHEAFGLTLLEGLTAGARIVASDLPSHREVATRWGAHDAVALVDVGDPGAMADAIVEQLHRGRVPSSARPTWSWQAMAETTRNIYACVLGSAPC
jgi:glycosyltransferase involved in cell wall biosynthesis